MSSSIETFSRLKELADNQAGYFTASQASSLGYANSQQFFHSKKGNWKKIFRNLYRLSGYKDSAESEFIKFSLLSIGRLDSPKAVISHESALYYYGLLNKAPNKTVFTVPHDFRTSVPASCKMYKKSLDEKEIVSAGVFKVTSISRTLHDFSISATKEELDKIATKAFEKNLVNAKELEAYGINSDTIIKRTGMSGSSPALHYEGGKENKFAVLAIRSEGHLHENMHRHLVSNLQKKGILPVSVNLDDNKETLKHGLDEVMSLNPLSIIIDGNSGKNIIDYLEANSNSFGSVTFIMDKPLRVSGKFKSQCVLSDYWFGSYMATKYLIGLGHKKIMLMTHKWKYAPGEFRLSIEYRFEEGYRMALKEAGLQDFEQHFYDSEDLEPNNSEFIKLLKSKKRPTAIVSSEDYRIASKLECFRKAKIRIPDDISLIGYYNTPWSTVTDLQLSTVSIKEEEIALKISEVLAGENRSNEIIVMPELVIRNSCRSIK